MNLADSMKNVLKNKSQYIFIDLWKDDVKIILKDVGRDVIQMAKSSSGTFKTLKRNGIKGTYREIMESASDTLMIFKVLPGRVKEGFSYFKTDLIHELENQPDQKQKTIYSLKVIGTLTSFTLGAVYNLKKGNADIAFKGLKRRNAVTQFIAAEIVLKLTQLFVYRFLNELEKEVSDPVDLKNVRFLKDLISNKSQLSEDASGLAPFADSAIEIVDNLKHFILTGKRT